MSSGGSCIQGKLIKETNGASALFSTIAFVPFVGMMQQQQQQPTTAVMDSQQQDGGGAPSSGEMPPQQQQMMTGMPDEMKVLSKMTVQGFINASCKVVVLAMNMSQESPEDFFTMCSDGTINFLSQVRQEYQDRIIGELETKESTTATYAFSGELVKSSGSTIVCGSVKGQQNWGVLVAFLYKIPTQGPGMEWIKTLEITAFDITSEARASGMEIEGGYKRMKASSVMGNKKRKGGGRATATSLKRGRKPGSGGKGGKKGKRGGGGGGKGSSSSEAAVWGKFSGKKLGGFSGRGGR